MVVALPASLSGWGMDVHRRITERALDGLPPEIKPFFDQQRAFIVEHSVDPDLWRVVDLRGELGEEDPNHFLDIDGLGEPRPFRAVPRDWDAYVRKYGAEKANRTGRLPWRAEEIYNRLVTAFQGIAKGTPAYAADNSRYLAGVLAHYIEDAHVPFHASANYNGQLTGQVGIHSRFETELPLRNWTTLKLAPVTIRPIPGMKDFIFDTLIASELLVGGILDADRRAIQGRELYDDGYFTQMLAATHVVLERRLSDAASGVASAIVSAWTEAGRPVLPLETSKTPARIRR
jgi:hypothetical protein